LKKKKRPLVDFPYRDYATRKLEGSRIKNFDDGSLYLRWIGRI